MKKALLLIAAVALLLAGCTKDSNMMNAVEEGQTITVNVVAQLDNANPATKAVWDNDGNGARVDHWIMEVYDAQGQLFYRKEKKGQSGLKNSFELALIKNQSYTFAFWADKDGSYKTDKLSEVRTVSNVAGLDGRDAFFAKKVYTPDMGTSISALLFRPFAQVNIVTLDLKKIFNQMAASGTTGQYGKYNPKEFKLSCFTYTKFNVLTGKASDAQYTELTLANCYGNFSAHVAKTTLFMDYLFAGTEKELKNFKFIFKSNGVCVNYDLANIPLQRNYRTNIYGNLLSNDATVNVEIVPIWEKPDYEVGL